MLGRGDHDEWLRGQPLRPQAVGAGDFFLEHVRDIDVAVCERAAEIGVERPGRAGAKQELDERMLFV
jgi:hypothetical protein